MTKLKCWKKSKYSDKGNFVFDKEGKESVVVHVYKHPFHSPPFRFVLHENHKVTDESQFKTYSQALKFANKYMKEHDKC